MAERSTRQWPLIPRGSDDSGTAGVGAVYARGVTSSRTAATAFGRVLTPGEPANRALRVGLVVLAAVLTLIAFARLVAGLPWGVDLVIPLEASERWLNGGQPYLASAFAEGPGYDLPYLYPPYALPLVAPLTVLPRQAVLVAWFVLSLAMAAWTCRALGVRVQWIPLLLAWPPFSEALINANVQIAIFAAFVLVLGGASERRPGSSRRRRDFPLVQGLVAAASAFLKVSQPHVIVHQVRWNRRAALVAVVAIAALAVATLPLIGTGTWLDWIEQLRRAADPSWALAGPSLGHFLPSPLGTVVVVGCLAAVLAVPRTGAAAWVGVLMVVGAPSLHTYYLLFLLPAMLRVRLEVSLVAAMLITTYTEPSWWLAIALIVGALLLSQRRPRLLEPKTADARGPDVSAAIRGDAEPPPRPSR